MKRFSAIGHLSKISPTFSSLSPSVTQFHESLCVFSREEVERRRYTQRMRYTMAMTTDKTATMLPSTEHAFKQHVLRAKFLTLIWCKGHIPNQELIEPVGRSWSDCDDGPKMHIQPSAPVEVRDLTHLHCTYTECVDAGKCSCLLAGLLCADDCFCMNSVNQNIKHV